MLVNPVFDVELWKKSFNPDMLTPDFVRFTKTDELFLLEVCVDGEWLPAAGYEKIQDGVYWTDMNPHIYLNDVYGSRVIGDLFDYIHRFNVEYSGEYVNFYGVADSPEQLLSHPDIVKNFIEPQDRKYVICCTPIFKKDESAENGWRWEKWGKYIGEKTPTAEYLYDEDEIDMVVVYHIFMILDEDTTGNFVL